MGWIKAALGIAASAYAKEAYVRPRQLGEIARKHCDSVRKPLLLIRPTTLVWTIVGDPVRAEVTTETAYPLRFPDKAFGAIFSAGVLERHRNPGTVLREWRRVADRVIVVVPSYWSPATWLDPRNRWILDPSLRMAAPLWDGRQHVHLLEVSDRGYGTRQWNPNSIAPTKSPHPIAFPTTQAAPRNKRINRSVYTPKKKPPIQIPTRTISPPDPSTPHSFVAQSDDKSSDPLSDPSLYTTQKWNSQETPPSESSTSVSHLMVVSALDSDESL